MSRPFLDLGKSQAHHESDLQLASCSGPLGHGTVMAIADILLAHVLCQTIGTLYTLSPLSIPEILRRVGVGKMRSSTDIFENRDSYGEGVKPSQIMSCSV